MGIYGTIFKKIKEKLGKKNKTKKKRKHMTPEQKTKRREKFRGAIKKARTFVQSGQMQNVSNTATRYSQGKPIVLQKKLTKEEKEETPDTISIFGYAIPKKTAYIAGGVLLVGTVFLITKAVKNKKHHG
jgi:hypothetical protein